MLHVDHPTVNVFNCQRTPILRCLVSIRRTGVKWIHKHASVGSSCSTSGLPAGCCHVEVPRIGLTRQAHGRP
jgi:hypothetical protein